jgi:hypothetical protein
MKTFAELMEQIPHMVQKPVDVARVQANALASRQQRRHVNQELAATATQEKRDRDSVYNA